jgi:hypothetical protein
MITRPTQMLRRTLTQEVRIILEPAQAGVMRRVQVLVPDSPKVSMALDKTPQELGFNREYKLPVMPPGAQITFDLLPQQFLVGVCGSGYAEVSLIVEYPE